MSGIYIKGMEMPENCFECPWRCKVDPENLLCRISGEYFEETFSGTIQNRHKSCPLVPVPPHGDLIDREALMDDIIGSMVFSGREVPKEAAIVQKVLDIVGDANAIIPTEEGE